VGSVRTCPALVRQLYDPIYSKWLRVEWEGLEKIPTDGGALLVANHAGAIPSDAPVIMHGIEKELGRPVYGMADYFFRTVPVVAPCGPGPVGCRPIRTTPTGCSTTSTSWPWSSPKAPRALQVVHRPLPAAPLRPGRLRRDRHAGRVPVIPIAVVGSEEAMPIVLRLPAVARALKVPYFPVTANLLVFGPLGVPVPFPAKFKLRVLDPVTFDVPPGQERYSKSRIMEEAETVRGKLQETLYEMLRNRRSVWFG